MLFFPASPSYPSLPHLPPQLGVEGVVRGARILTPRGMTFAVGLQKCRGVCKNCGHGCALGGSRHDPSGRMAYKETCPDHDTMCHPCTAPPLAHFPLRNPPPPSPTGPRHPGRTIPSSSGASGQSWGGVPPAPCGGPNRLSPAVQCLAASPPHAGRPGRPVAGGNGPPG